MKDSVKVSSLRGPFASSELWPAIDFPRSGIAKEGVEMDL